MLEWWIITVGNYRRMIDQYISEELLGHVRAKSVKNGPEKAVFDLTSLSFYLNVSCNHLGLSSNSLRGSKGKVKSF